LPLRLVNVTNAREKYINTPHPLSLFQTKGGNNMNTEKTSFFKRHFALIAILILAVALVGAISYILLGKIQANRQIQLQQIAQQGMNYGLQQTIVSLFQQTDNCQVANIYLENVTRQVIDIACLQQPRG